MAGRRAPKTTDEIARALGRASADYLLRSLEVIRTATNGSLLDSVICLAVARGNLHHYLGDERFERTFAALDTIPPETVRRPVSIRGLADFLDLPYETVRRNVLKLVEGGLLVKRDGGYTMPAHMIDRPVWHDAIRANVTNVERLLRVYRRLTEQAPAETAE
jgi:hypothetical protein